MSIQKFSIIYYCLLFFGFSDQVRCQSTDDFYYCHDNISLRDVIKINDSTAIIFSTSLTELYLLDKENLIVDTLLVSQKGNMIQGIEIIGPNRVAYNTLNEYGIIGIKNYELHINDEHKVNMDEKPFYAIFKYDYGEIGWKKEAVDKNRIDYGFYFIESNSGSIIKIFSPFEEKSKFKGSGNIISHKYYNTKLNEIYIPVEASSLVVKFNIRTQHKEIIRFPEIDARRQSWYYYYDHFEDTHYAVLFNKKDKNIVYEMKGFSENMEKLMEIDFVPKRIYDGYLIYISENQDAKDKFCFYEKPID